MLESNMAQMIDPNAIPDGQSALQRFESIGGHITIFTPFGEDPLATNPSLITQRETEFFRLYQDLSPAFHSLVNGDYYLFREGLLCLIDISKRLAHSM